MLIAHGRYVTAFNLLNLQKYHHFEFDEEVNLVARADQEDVVFVVVGDNQIYKFGIDEGSLQRPREKCDFGLHGKKIISCFPDKNCESGLYFLTMDESESKLNKNTFNLGMSEKGNKAIIR
jgi:hypothetical protein